MFNKLKMYKDLKNIQNSLADENAEGSGAWGKVKVNINGQLQVTKVEIDPDLLNPDEKDKLEDGIKDAVNDANKQASQLMADKIKNSGIDLPQM